MSPFHAQRRKKTFSKAEERKVLPRPIHVTTCFTPRRKHRAATGKGYEPMCSWVSLYAHLTFIFSFLGSRTALCIMLCLICTSVGHSLEVVVVVCFRGGQEGEVEARVGVEGGQDGQGEPEPGRGRVRAQQQHPE